MMMTDVYVPPQTAICIVSVVGLTSGYVGTSIDLNFRVDVAFSLVLY